MLHCCGEFEEAKQHVDKHWKSHSKKFSSLSKEIREQLKTTKKRIGTLFNHASDTLEDLKLTLDNLKEFESAYFESFRKQKKQPLNLSTTTDFFKPFVTAHGLIQYIKFKDKKQTKGCFEKIAQLCTSRKGLIASNGSHALQRLIIEKLNSIITRCQDEEMLFFSGVTLPLEKDIQALLTAFKTHQYKARIVGGYVRDKLCPITRVPHDVDIIVCCSQDEVKNLLRRLGYQYFSSPHVNGLIQIKNRDLSYPIDIICTHKPLEEEARLRDMTVNALFCDEDGNALDPLGVIEDIVKPALQIIGDVEERIHQDAKIILRLIYYHFYLKKELPHDYISKIQKHGSSLATLSLKVYANYINKLFLKNDSPAVLNFLIEQDLLKYLWPRQEDLIKATKREEIEKDFDTFLHRYPGEINSADRACLVKRMAAMAWHYYHPSPAYLPLFNSASSPQEKVNELLHLQERAKSLKLCPG